MHANAMHGFLLYNLFFFPGNLQWSKNLSNQSFLFLCCCSWMSHQAFLFFFTFSLPLSSFLFFPFSQLLLFLFFPLFPNSFFGLRKEQTHPLWLRKEQNPKIKIPFIKWLNIEIIWICTLRHINARNSWLLICSFQPNIYVGSMDI